MAEQGVVVWVQVRDTEDLPIPNFPYQDMWLDDNGDLSLSLCQDGAVADGNTDASGTTTISGALFAGGYTPAGTKVWIQGTPVFGDALGLRLVSPDINGDLVVDVLDLVRFGAAFGTPDAAADFDADGGVGLVDFGILGVHYGDHCP